MLSVEEFKEVYELLDRATPVEGDCGKMCGAACCAIDGKWDAEVVNPEFKQSCDDLDLVMHLMHGEEQMHDMDDEWLEWEAGDPEEYGLSEDWTRPFYMVKCHGAHSCKRNLRPIQCRTFPLTPYLSEEGELKMIVFPENLPYICPIIEKKLEMDPEYIKNAYKAWKMLIGDDAIYDMVYEDSRVRDEENH